MNKVAQIISWIFSILFLLCGVIGLLNEPLAGFILILIGLVLLPPCTVAASRFFNFTPNWIVKWIIICILLIIFAMVAEPVKDDVNNASTETTTATITILNDVVI